MVCLYNTSWDGGKPPQFPVAHSACKHTNICSFEKLLYGQQQNQFDVFPAFSIKIFL